MEKETAITENATAVDQLEQLHDAETSGKLEAITTELANRGTRTEHELGTWEALKIYRKGAFWSMFISLSIIMRAYDIEISGNFYALPAFQQHFGFPVPGHGYQVPARWQVAISMGSLVGQVIGAYLVTFPMEKYGRKK